MAMNEIFVYGTLKQDHYNNDLLGDSQLLGNYETLPQWGLISLGSFPGMVPSNKAVKGEVYLVDEDTLSINAIKGFYGHVCSQSKCNISPNQAQCHCT